MRLIALKKIHLLFGILLGIFILLPTQRVSAAQCTDGTEVAIPAANSIANAEAWCQLNNHGHLQDDAITNPGGGATTRTPVESCHSGGFFGFPTWFKYLRGEEQQNDSFDARIGKTCEPVIGGIKDVLLIGAAILEILLRIAVFLAIGLVVWGAIQFIIGQGEPDRVSAARSTIVNAVIGLVVVVVASAVISFVAGRFVAS